MIWAILILTSIGASLNLVTLQANAEVTAYARQTYKRHGAGIGAPAGCLIAVVGWAILVCWCVYAWQVADWRFAAIPAISMGLRLLGSMLFKPSKAEAAQ